MTALHLVQLELDAARLYAFARRMRLPTYQLDDGYAVHALLAALFDHGARESDTVAPKPFHLCVEVDADGRRVAGRRLRVLGYAKTSHEALRERAERFADPVAWGVCDLERLASKPMPALPTGARLGFTARVCPVRRIAKRGPMTRERAEVDAFLAKSWAVGADVALDREEVYREWVAEELDKAGAKLESARLARFEIEPTHRRTQATDGAERQGRRVKRPDATFEGTLQVADSSLFQERLARGLGRHRAFGFGMVLLRPAPSGSGRGE